MNILSFHHCNIQVRDLDEAVVFYRDVMGLPIREEDSSVPTRVGKSVWFDCGDKQLHVTVGTYPEAKGQHFGIEVDDVEAVAKEMEARGIKVPDRKISSGRRYLKLADPTGNVIELLSQEI